MKTVKMSKDFDFPINPQQHVAYQAGETYKDRPEAQVEAIVKAGAGEIVKDDAPAKKADR